jgi:hypothetical protein
MPKYRMNLYYRRNLEESIIKYIFDCLHVTCDIFLAIKRNVMEQAESPFSTPLTPHSEAASTLARIGDEIKDYYGERLNMAVSGVCAEEQRNISYENFRCFACSVIDHVVPGWRQVGICENIKN